MKYNPFEVPENNDGERYEEIHGFKFSVVEKVSYGADSGGNGFMIVAFDDGRFIRVDAKGQVGSIEINTGRQDKPPTLAETYAKLTAPAQNWVDETYAKLTAPAQNWVDETYAKLVGEKKNG